MDKVVCFDLDDTLIKEIRYLESAFKEIAGLAVLHCEESVDSRMMLKLKAYNEMMSAYHAGKNVFEELNSFLDLSFPVKYYLDLYRNHIPDLQLLPNVSDLLDELKDYGCVLGIISDGRSVQQRNKINALGLEKWIDSGNVVISEEFGSEKPSLANFEFFMNRYPSAEYTYVGDNPKKDFVAPNHLGWNTICLLDDGENVHKQDFTAVSDEYLPKVKIQKLSEMIGLI